MKHFLTITILLCLSIHFRTEAQTVPVTLKVIDQTAGKFTGNTHQIFSWVAMWNPSYVEYKNSGSWYSNFFDGYTGGKLTKTATDWTWSYTFNAPKGGSFSWNPSIGTPGGNSSEIGPIYGFREKGKNIDFFVSSIGVITGETAIIYDYEYIALADVNGTITNKQSLYDSINENIPDTTGNNFLHALGRQIVDEHANPIILKGIGLGNYMLIEPYMWGINNAKEKKSDTQQAILASLTKLTGEDNVNAFMDAYQKNYISETDVQFLKESGFNSIRLPMHYNLFIETTADDNRFVEKGFTMIDQLLSWCKKHEVYLILDMHALPGGQSTDKAISDQYSPGLWDGNTQGTATQYQTKLVTLWKEIARRYANEKWIGGYDLINEIMYYPPGRDLSPEIRSLYGRITSAIREVDKKHLLFIEGNGYANDHKGLTPAWDNNMAYSFHRYWSGNSKTDIQYMLTLRNTYNVPIWMGESGENSNTWFTDAIELLESNQIGWAWWSYKKVSNISGIISVPRPEGWDKILSYLQSGTDNSASLGLNAETTKNILMALAENTRLEPEYTQLQKAKVNKDVVWAMLSQPFNYNTMAYGPNYIPGKLFATEYNMGRNDRAYYKTGILSRESINAGAYNEGWVGRNDAVDIEVCTDTSSNRYNVGWTNQGEWLNYTSNVTQTGRYRVKINYAVTGTGNVTIKLNDQPVLSNISLPTTGAWNIFKQKELGEIEIPEGVKGIQVYINSPFNFSSIVFELVGNTTGMIQHSSDQSYSFDGVCPTLFTNQTSFVYTLPEEVNKVTFRIFNLQGSLIDVKSGPVDLGKNQLEYSNLRLTSGIYQNEMSVENKGRIVYKESMKMIVK